jgi:hypothetical protein
VTLTLGSVAFGPLDDELLVPPVAALADLPGAQVLDARDSPDPAQWKKWRVPVTYIVTPAA